MDSPREHERRFPCDDGLSGNNEKWEKMIEGMHTYTPMNWRHISRLPDSGTSQSTATNPGTGYA